MQLINWKRAVWSRQLLDCRQRYERGMYCVSCGHVQRDEWVLGSERVLGVSCGSVLLGTLQLIERKWAVLCGQLLDRGQWCERGLHALSGRPILPIRLQQQRGQRSVWCGQLFCCRQRHHSHMQCLSCWRVLLGWLQLVERKRAVLCGQLLDCRQRCNCGLLCMPRRHLQCDRRVHFCWSLSCVPCWSVLPCRL